METTETQSYKFAVTIKRKSCPLWKWQLQEKGERSQTNEDERTYTEIGKEKARQGDAEIGSIQREITYFEGGKGSEEKRLHYLPDLPANKQSWKRHQNTH